MKYENIPDIDIRKLPEHINILKNLQELHFTLINLSEIFSVISLNNLIINYEERINNLISRCNKLASKNEIFMVIHKLGVVNNNIDFDKLLIRKKSMIVKVEEIIEKWKQVCRKIESKVDQNEAE